MITSIKGHFDDFFTLLVTMEKAEKKSSTDLVCMNTRIQLIICDSYSLHFGAIDE